MGNGESLWHHQLAKCVSISLKLIEIVSHILSGQRMELGRGHCPGVGDKPLTELLFAMIRPIVGKKLAGSDSIDLL